MGDLRDWSPELNGAVLEDRPSSSSSLSSSPPPLSVNLTGIGSEYWQRAEEATTRIIGQVHPTVVSEKRRKVVIDYVQRLLGGYLGCEVFPFGSVPLKTYLPDGDIDLTAFGGLNIEDALANDVCAVLESEEQNKAAVFMVKDVQLIRAEVKLVKCLVQNIVVDISFNQLGGLCTLCFLEKVDCLIGKNHLFKRSIILIKAWCYYESRILGAHHGLISTYALETLVLYIFHLFNSSLNGPLAVLYKFLDYFSNFDWDNYCISLNGPVRISSLPELLAETSENTGHDLLLTDDFLKGCVEMFSAPSRGYETSSRTFPQKHLNIVDPLKENNNLGRSVSKGNFYRIRSAFTYGARKLGRILSQSEENIGDEIQKFFSNTLERHGKGQRPDVQDPLPMSGQDELSGASFFLDAESQEIQAGYEAESCYSSGMTGECRLNHEESLPGGVPNVEISGIEVIHDRLVNEQRRSSLKVMSLKDLSIPRSFLNGTAVSDNRLQGDAEDLATSRLQNLTISNNTPKSSPTRHAPHLYFAHSPIGNGETNCNEEIKRVENNGSTENSAGDQDGQQFVSNHKVVSPVASKQHLSRLSSIALSSEDFYPSYSGYRLSTVVAGSPEPFNGLSDLSGDFDSLLNSLHYGRWCYDSGLTASVPSMAPMLSQFHGKKSWDVIRRTVQLKQNVFSQVNTNGVVHRPAFYPMNPPLLPGGVGFGVEEMPKPRGTGTYFPNMNHYRDRPMTPRGRNQMPVRSPRNDRLVTVATENGVLERSSRDTSQSHPIHKGNGKSGSVDDPSGSPRRKVNTIANGSMHLSEHHVEFGSTASPPSEAAVLKGSWQTNSGLSPFQNSNASPGSPGMEKLKPVLSMDNDRIAVKSYHLKDEDDFPPLSV
ncbi:PAP/OAS1 substrate-binding domain superfamily [Parasponia andersonii]|uniref:PAP/OAS1 substrate-binding domain superfamily n=1 Tax=Parasponia andersonii TaxID=3476 RepID=A0A2P5B790_PARAD|nr:PAP/OAS1 substrate-binding domain superfamily [Parasponia andersonii]